MNKKPIKPIKGTEQIFKISQKRIETGESLTNKTGKTYKLEEDLELTRMNYQKIIDSLPAQPGILILTGHYKNGKRTLEIIKTNESIRSSFSRLSNKNRFHSLLNYIKEDLFDHVQIQLAQAS